MLEFSDFKPVTLKLSIPGDNKKFDQKFYTRAPWFVRSFFLSEACSFRNRDRELMLHAFYDWFDWIIKEFGKSKFIDCVILVRREVPSKRRKSKK